MSRIGKKEIPVPKSVEVTIDQQVVEVKGSRGVLRREFPVGVAIVREGEVLRVTMRSSGRVASSQWGLSRTLLANMVVGVANGFTKTLEIHGVGYRAAVAGRDLKISLGYSHEIVYPIPDGLEVAVDKNTIVTVSGADKELIGQTCANIRSFRTPEPYKGKGVRYTGEYVPLKVGKKKK